MDTETKLKKTLLIAGASLFLIGLLSGIAVQLTENPRMGLSAHLAGVQNALFLLVIGATWDHIRLSDVAAAAGAWISIVSMYGFWIAFQLGAVWGTSRGTPIAGAGFEGTAWQERVVEIILQASSGAAVIAAMVIVVGFWRGRHAWAHARRNGQASP